jgi:hypothetical protein
MRKIEAEMLAAIKDGRDWQSGNTQAIQKGGFTSDIYLHGNRIGWAVFGLYLRCVPNVETFRQYPTRTTVSRLRALGINASVRKGVPMIDGVPV